jgi:eukaryotic-like serine/threonine-protein kinase
MRGDIIILNLTDGKPLWTYELGIPISGSPAVIGSRFIFAAEDGGVYCFGEGPI